MNTTKTLSKTKKSQSGFLFTPRIGGSRQILLGRSTDCIFTRYNSLATNLSSELRLPRYQQFIPEAFHTCVKKCFFNLFLCVKELR
jgi:hypothetical protein